jgi:hypothetical protein
MLPYAGGFLGVVSKKLLFICVILYVYFLIVLFFSLISHFKNKFKNKNNYAQLVRM